MKKILCPVNFTDTALNALEYACHLSSMHEADLTLVHVITDEEYQQLLESESGNIRLRLEKETNELQERLEVLCQEIRNTYPAIDCDQVILAGDLTAKVVDFAKTGHYGLIVMGNEGVIDVTEAINGSSTVQVIERSPCPVLSVPSQATFQGFRKVVFGTEFMKSDREALMQLYLLLKPAASNIEVVHIAKPGESQNNHSSREKISELKTYLNYPEIQFAVKEYPGNVRLGLHEYMEESRADLLVLLTHQRNFLERIFQQSISKRISYFADYPILVYLEENL